MRKITLETSLGEVMTPLGQITTFSVADSFLEARDKGYEDLPPDTPVLVRDGEKLLLLTTLERLRSSYTARTWQVLEAALLRSRMAAQAPLKYEATTPLLALSTLPDSTLKPVIAVTDESGEIVGAATWRHLQALFSSLDLPGWPDAWRDEFALDPVLSLDHGMTVAALAAYFGAWPADDKAFVASNDRQNDRWIVCRVGDLIDEILGKRPKPGPDYMIEKVFSRLYVTEARLEAHNAGWAAIRQALPPDSSQGVLLAHGERALAVVWRKATRERALAGSPKAVVRRGSDRVAALLQDYPPQTKTQDGRRVVNHWFADRQKRPCSPRRALAANARYYVAANVGLPDPEKTNVVGAQVDIADLLTEVVAPGQALTFRLDSEDFLLIEREQSASLSAAKTTGDLFLAVATPVKTGLCWLRLGVYFENNLIQSYRMYAYVAPQEGPMPKDGVDGWWSQCEYTLSSDLARLDDLETRRVCIWLGEGRQERAWRGGISEAGGLDMGPALAPDSMFLKKAFTRYRELLMKASVQGGDGAQYLYRPDLTPVRPAVFDRGIKDLAELGQMLYYRIFGEQNGRTVARRLQEVERSRSTSAPMVVQIARLNLDLTVPWAALYDRPLRYNPKRNVVCHEFARDEPCRAGCPHAQDDNVICPYGFWGFRYIIEQPLRPPGAFTSAPTRLEAEGRPQLALVYGTGLQRTASHRRQISALLQSRGEAKSFTATDDLLAALKAPAGPPTAVYFYCHGGNSDFNQWLVVRDDDPLLTIHLDDELRAAWETPREGVAAAPLVVLNGCHTAQYAPDTLLSFVHRFAGLGAAGVIGTEIPIHEYMGVAFGEFWLDRFLAGQPIGKIVYDFRQRLLKKQNLLGLVYVPYCYADLRLEKHKGGAGDG